MSTCSQSLKMSQCVPSWEIEENPSIRIPFHPSSLVNNPSKSPDVIDPTRDYEVAELTWENGQLALHALGPPRTLNTKSNPSGRYTTTTWEKPRASGTLESIVNQAAQLAPCEAPPVLQGHADNDELVTWFNHQPAGAMDALVPSSSNNIHFPTPDPNHGKSTCVESSCGGSASIVKGKHSDRGGATVRKRRHVPRDNRSHRNHRSMTVSVSETFGRDSSRHVGGDSCEIGLTSTSLASDTNANTLDDHDSMSQSRPPKPARTKEEKSCQNEKSTISIKRSRAAAIHNQSERKRRDKINQRMKTLQKLVPNSSKTDKASMLDEVIEYLKTLQAQVQVMGRMSMPHMMMPMPMQQQLQMAMMAQMGMGMGMGMGVMDINSMARPNISGMPPVLNPAAFMPMTSWETPNDRFASSNPVLPDPMASFLASQSQQPMTIDAYSRMAAMYQQLHQQHGSNLKP